MRILIVDDEPLILCGMAQALRGEGYETLAAASPAEALALVSSAVVSSAVAEGRPTTCFDLLITDVHMPKMSGHALAKELRQRRATRVTLFISGSPVEPSELGEHGPSADSILLKPFGLTKLLGAVCDLIGPGSCLPRLAPLAAPSSEQNLGSR